MITPRTYRLLLSTIVVFSTWLPLHAQKLLAGPMMGHNTATEVRLWTLVSDCNSVSIVLSDSATGKTWTHSAKTDTCFGYKGKHACTFIFEELPSGSTFTASVKLDDKEFHPTARLFTLKDRTHADFTFLAGSCMLLPPKILNPIYPGIQDRICNHMAPHAGDFMLWLGDYLYYRPRDVRTPLAMFNRQVKKRTNRRLEKFHRASGGNYTIWDDHDFGPNNANSSFRLKDESLKLHKAFWANPYNGTKELEGTYSHFSHYDTDFFLLDDRLHRTLPKDADAAVLQEKQIDWLLSNLKKSTATFKFIVIGTQFITEMSTGEHHFQYPKERQRIIRFIKDENIDGVIFLSGDMHYTELLKLEKDVAYPLYELTCSPMTSVVYKTPIRNNPLNVGNSLTFYRNFADISIHGEPSARKCLVTIRDEFGRKLWDYTISSSELRVK